MISPWTWFPLFSFSSFPLLSSWNTCTCHSLKHTPRQLFIILSQNFVRLSMYKLVYYFNILILLTFLNILLTFNIYTEKYANHQCIITTLWKHPYKFYPNKEIQCYQHCKSTFCAPFQSLLPSLWKEPYPDV